MMLYPLCACAWVDYCTQPQVYEHVCVGAWKLQQIMNMGCTMLCVIAILLHTKSHYVIEYMVTKQLCVTII